MNLKTDNAFLSEEPADTIYPTQESFRVHIAELQMGPLRPEKENERALFAHVLQQFCLTAI